MTPPTVEYWRVWSDTLGQWHWDRKGNKRAYLTLAGAERAVRSLNKHNPRVLWRPVRVRETVIKGPE